MDPTRAIKARVGAARLLLDQHVAGSALHERVSRLQAAAIMELVGQSTLSSQVRADLSGTVLGMNLHPPDMHAILGSLSEGVAVSSGAKRRRVQQNWMAVHNYGTAEFWTRLQDPAMPGSCKLDLILQLAIGLGLRLPTEPSIKWMTSWWLSVAEEPSEVARMDGAAKKTMLAHVKATFDGLRKAAGDPVLFLEKLPENAVVFLRDAPSLYHVCFVAGPPVVPAMSIQNIAAIDMTYGCRGGAAKLQPQAASQLALPNVSLQLGDSPMERMASMMFQRMEAMATNQQRLMEMAMTGAVTGAGHRANPRPLAALAGSSPLMLRKLPTMAVGGPCLALGDASSDASGTPPPKAARLTITVGSPTSVIPGSEDTLVGVEDHEEDGAEADDLAKMLDMMAERKAAAAAAAAAIKSKNKTTGDATGEGTGEGIGHAGAAKGKGKGKTKSTGDGTGEGIGDADKGNGKGHGKGKGKTKSSGKLTLKIKAKPQAKVLAKAVNKAAAPDVLGCSKCRWGKGGCKQCKNPKFSGLRFS
jgi:hypothetical protein